MAIFNIYYSPTGGTKTVSDTLAGTMGKGVQNIDLLKKDRFGQRFASDDVCVISVPAFGGRVPGDAAEKIKSFCADGAKAVLIAAFGNRAIDDTLIELYDLAVSSGFTVVAGVEAVTEHSLVRKYGKGRPNANDKTQLESFAKQIAKKFEAGDTTSPSIPGNRPYREYKPSAMSLVVDVSCVDCKKCAAECPADAIPMDNVKIVCAGKCFSCMHCVSVCPMKARHNSPTATDSLEEKLRDRCSGTKPNTLYI